MGSLDGLSRGDECASAASKLSNVPMYGDAWFEDTSERLSEGVRLCDLYAPMFIHSFPPLPCGNIALEGSSDSEAFRGRFMVGKFGLFC